MRREQPVEEDSAEPGGGVSETLFVAAQQLA